MRDASAAGHLGVGCASPRAGAGSVPGGGPTAGVCLLRAGGSWLADFGGLPGGAGELPAASRVHPAVPGAGDHRAAIDRAEGGAAEERVLSSSQSSRMRSGEMRIQTAGLILGSRLGA
eukprot:scaffold2998_cov239-Pinguiococcus_pyrenoidosus.AAC.2